MRSSARTPCEHVAQRLCGYCKTTRVYYNNNPYNQTPIPVDYNDVNNND